MKTWMRRRGDRVKIISGKYAGHTGTVESNVWFHIMLDTEAPITVRREQVEEVETARKGSNNQR